MNSIKSLAMIIAVVLFNSCGSMAKFPVSNTVPAADISAKTQKQGKYNYLVTITAKGLAASDRLVPPKKYYVIWAVSESSIVRNVGHFIQRNASKSTYKASFPYKPIELFITAEDKEGNCIPDGIEISRIRL